MILNTIVLLFVLQGSLQSDENLPAIRPGDPYKLRGQIESYKTEDDCSVDVAWLKPPIHSKMAFHGHESACARVQFQKTLSDNKTASLIDIWSLNQLLNNEQFQSRKWNQLKCFFIRNRIGDLAISVLIHPKPDEKESLKIKLDILDLKKETTHMPPQDVLCVRFSCPQPVLLDSKASLIEESKEIKPPLEKFEMNSTKSNITVMSYRLNEKELLNRELNRQIIIYRIACALLTGLMIIFGIMTAGMCVKVRNYPRKLKQISKIQQNYVMPYNFETNQTPSYYHMNGKLGLTPPSPLISNDNHGHHQSLDTSSVNNIIMTNSNMSACDGHLGNQTYVSYPMTNGTLTNNEGLVAYVPVVNRPSISAARNYIVSCTGSTNQISLSQNNNNNGNCSPSSSILEGKINNGSVNSSLTRQHSNNLSRRKMVVMGKNISSMNSSDVTLSPNLLSQYNNQFNNNNNENTFGKVINTPTLNNNHENVIHRFPNDFHMNGSRVNSEIETSSFLSSLTSTNNNFNCSQGNGQISNNNNNTLTAKSNAPTIPNVKSLLVQ